jgi:uncharacterized protein
MCWRVFARNIGYVNCLLFGSMLTDAVKPDSDIDLLVEFEPGKEPGLIGMGQIEAELASLLGRRVDLRTAQDLSRYFRDEVLHKAEELWR